MRGLAWIMQVGPRCNYMYLYKKKAKEDLTQKKRQCDNLRQGEEGGREGGGERERWGCHAAVIIDRGRGHKPRNAALEAAKFKKKKRLLFSLVLPRSIALLMLWFQFSETFLNHQVFDNLLQLPKGNLYRVPTLINIINKNKGHNFRYRPLLQLKNRWMLQNQGNIDWIYCFVFKLMWYAMKNWAYC